MEFVGRFERPGTQFELALYWREGGTGGDSSPGVCYIHYSNSEAVLTFICFNKSGFDAKSL